MAPTSKKSSKTKAKPRRAVVKPQPKQTNSIKALQRELAEALARENTTSEILRMIVGAGTNLQSVMDTIAENAAKLCDVVDAVVWRVDENVLRHAAHFGPVIIQLARGEGHPITRDSPNSRAVVDRQTVHVHDLPAAVAEFPLAKNRGVASGLRTVLATPLLRDGLAVGCIQIRRTEMRPFTDSQIKLLETFADQVVIAIENTRLIHEQHARNRELSEALEQQTATSEILRVIASSPTELQTGARYADRECCEAR